MIKIKTDISDELREILEGVSFWQDQIDRQRKRIDLLIEAQTSISINNDGLPKGSNNRDLSDYIAQLETCNEELDYMKHRQNEAYDRIFNLVVCLRDPKLVEVIYCRYIYLMSWKQISKKMHKTKEYLLILHGEALKKFEEIVKK